MGRLLELAITPADCGRCHISIRLKPGLVEGVGVAKLSDLAGAELRELMEGTAETCGAEA